MECSHRSSVQPKGSVGTISVPCNRCIQCRINKTEEWKTRVEFEAANHEKKAFITLTYDDEHLPQDATLVKKHIQDFNKRVRKHYYGNKAGEYKYYFCGEYGPSTLRPHYHGAVLGIDFDMEEWICYRIDKDGRHYYSPTLLSLWPFGFNEVSFLNPTTIRYVTGYIQKKLMGDQAQQYFDRGVIPPFQLYSTNLGVATLQKYSQHFLESYVRDDGKGKHFSKYYQTKLGLNEVMANEFQNLAQARREEFILEDRSHYPELSDFEYAQLTISRRLQKELDLNARYNILHSRSKL